MAYLIAGLGNPGEEYEGTRHNTGEIVRQLIATKLDGQAKFLAPTTFMNDSGQVIAKVVKSPKAAERLVVIHDDLDLPLGRFKIVFNRGPGGHRGVESVIKKLKTQAFIRVRVGISPTTPSGKLKKPVGEEKVIKFILGKFKADELAVLKKEAKKIAEALEVLITESPEKAMTLYNGQ